MGSSWRPNLELVGKELNMFPLIPAKAGTQVFVHEPHERSRQALKFVLFVWFVDESLQSHRPEEKAWVPAFAGMSGWNGDA
jgi:hypothetical protein